MKPSTKLSLAKGFISLALVAASVAGGVTTNRAGAQTRGAAVAGWQFNWSQGLVLDHTFATGTNLVTKYQAVYGLGVLLTDGSITSDGVILMDSALMSDGVILGDYILTSNGVLMVDGVPFLPCDRLAGDGVMLGDGAMMTDGLILGDGALLTDGTLLADVSAQAGLALIHGDNTPSMSTVVEAGLPPATPGGLKAAAASKTQINLSWADNSSDETGFHVERSTDGVNFAQVGTPGAGARSFASTGLTGGRKYFFRVRAYNANGNSAYTAVVNATTPTK